MPGAAARVDALKVKIFCPAGCPNVAFAAAAHA
jgi:hypothetical protein